MVSRSARHFGFTLIELIVVLAIVAVLAALTLAALQQAREASRRTECLNRLRQQGVAVLNYESAFGHLPPGAVQGPFPLLGVPNGVSFGLWPLLLPYLEQEPVAAQFQLTSAYNDPLNQPAVTVALAALVCPNGPPGRTEMWEPPPGYGAVADYAPVDVNPFLADIGLIDPAATFAGALPVNGAVRLQEITDGTSRTLLLVEAGGRPGVAWSSPLLPVGVRQFFGQELHRNGSPACMADGSVHFLSGTTDVRVLARLATRAGGEVISDF